MKSEVCIKYFVNYCSTVLLPNIQSNKNKRPMNPADGSDDSGHSGEDYVPSLKKL